MYEKAWTWQKRWGLDEANYSNLKAEAVFAPILKNFDYALLN